MPHFPHLPATHNPPQHPSYVSNLVNVDIDTVLTVMNTQQYSEKASTSTFTL